MVVCGGGDGGGVTGVCGDEETDDSMMVINSNIPSAAAIYNNHAHDNIDVASIIGEDQMIIDDLPHLSRNNQQHFFSPISMLSGIKNPSAALRSVALQTLPSTANTVLLVPTSSAALPSAAATASLGADHSSSSHSGSAMIKRKSTGGGVAAEDPNDMSSPSFHCQFLPLPVDLDLHSAIMEVVALEPKTQPALSLIEQPRDAYEISGRMRNGSCHVLRCLKVWYELPSETFFLAVNTMDRFLTRMRAQPKHLSCIAVSAFHLACEEMSNESGCPVPSRESVSAISQSKCTSNDVARMEEIIRTKMEMPFLTALHQHNVPKPVTPITMLKLVHTSHEKLSVEFFPPEKNNNMKLGVPALVPLVHKLEVVVCDTRAANFRPAELAIALFKRELLNQDAINFNAHNSCLQPVITLCKINMRSLEACEEIVSLVLRGYDTPGQSNDTAALYHRQRLVWKVSNRTFRQLRPTDRLRRHRRMATIKESTGLLAGGWQNVASSSSDTTGSSEEESDQEHDSSVMESENSVEAARQQQQENQDGCDTDDNREKHDEESMETCEADARSGVAPDLTAGVEKMEEDGVEQNVVAVDVIPATLNKQQVQEANIIEKAHKNERCSADKEESYSQVAKKMREEDKSPKQPDSKRKALRPPLCMAVSFHNGIQTSPLSKITLTPVLSTSSAVMNLSHMLEKAADPCEGEAGLYNYHRRRLVGILGLEGIDGDVFEDLNMPRSIPHTSTRNRSTSSGNAKRKKQSRLKLQLVTQPSCECSDSEMPSENASSSEEEMDSDYEKEFPPLPLPRSSSHSHKLAAVRKKTSSVAPIKKKKKSDASPYATKSKAMRKLHDRKIVQK
uniref:Cyclin G2 n=1 Tax=Hirondellea gigas TaxID=1518452 RepID=A0A6A7FP18_9CRUS